MMRLHQLLFLVVAMMVMTTSVNAQSYWTVYEGDAPKSCVVDDGQEVDITCCTAKPPQGFITDFYSSTCFVISGLLDGGLALQSYLGCDDGEPVYDEACYNNGTNGGIIPANVTVEDVNATDIDDCGCQFQVSGNGCHKIRDFSSLPGFEADTRQVFLLMNETCTEDPGTSSSGAAGKPMMMILTAMIAALVCIVR